MLRLCHQYLLNLSYSDVVLEVYAKWTQPFFEMLVFLGAVKLSKNVVYKILIEIDFQDIFEKDAKKIGHNISALFLVDGSLFLLLLLMNWIYMFWFQQWSLSFNFCSKDDTPLSLADVVAAAIFFGVGLTERRKSNFLWRT